jgi:hypothetical protein
MELTSAKRQEKVSAAIDKFYAAPASGQVNRVLPLGGLVFLEEGPEIAVSPLSGSERMARLQDEHYTAQQFAIARGFDRHAYFIHLAELASRVPMWSFARPRDLTSFDQTVEVVGDHLLSQPAATCGRGQR